MTLSKGQTPFPSPLVGEKKGNVPHEFFQHQMTTQATNITPPDRPAAGHPPHRGEGKEKKKKRVRAS
jgi:hypothetical protein